MGITCSKTRKNEVQPIFQHENEVQPIIKLENEVQAITKLENEVQAIIEQENINTEDIFEQIQAQDFICNIWVPREKKQIQLLIKITEEKEIQYITDDQSIIRIDALEDIPLNHQILTNLELIKYVKWEVEYGKKNKKLVKFNVSWRDSKLPQFGGYLKNGKKQGLWAEFFQYNPNQNLYISGEYINEKRIGVWKQTLFDEKIGGGQYNNNGQQNGKWIELSENVSSYQQFTYEGEYKNGEKVGIWNIFQRNQLMGGGMYHYSKKTGQWSELIDSSILSGQYNQSGKKCDYWDLWDGGKIIGGGYYDDTVEGDSIKDGRWREIDQIAYYKKGRKVAGTEIYDFSLL